MLRSRGKLGSFRVTKISILTNESRRLIFLKYVLDRVTKGIVDQFDWLSGLRREWFNTVLVVRGLFRVKNIVCASVCAPIVCVCVCVCVCVG